LRTSGAFWTKAQKIARYVEQGVIALEDTRIIAISASRFGVYVAEQPLPLIMTTLATLVHGNGSHDLVGAWRALVGGDGFDPDAPALVEDAEVRLATLALAVGHGQQRPARFEQSAAEIHLPEAPIDVAGEALPKIRIGIGQ